MPISRSFLLVPTLLSVVTIAANAADTKSVEAQLAELKQAQAKLETQVAEMSRGSKDRVAGALKLLDLSLSVEAGGGASTERDESIRNLQGGGHDPKQRGFTMPNAELSIGGAVDPYFYAQSNIVLFTFFSQAKTNTVSNLTKIFKSIEGRECDWDANLW